MVRGVNRTHYGEQSLLLDEELRGQLMELKHDCRKAHPSEVARCLASPPIFGTLLHLQ